MKVKELYSELNNGNTQTVITNLANVANTAEEFHILGKAYESELNWKLAIKFFTKSIQKHGDNKIFSLRRRSECYMRDLKWSNALVDSKYIFKYAKNVLSSDCKRLSKIQAALGEYRSSAQTINKYTNQWVNENKSSLIKGKIILTATLPKTGSTSMSYALAAAAGYQNINFLCRPSNSKFSGSGTPSKRSLLRLKGFGIVNHCHLEPKNSTLEIIKDMEWVKIVLHIRNPIDSLLSVLDMVRRIHEPFILKNNPALLDLKHDAQMDWMIKNYLPYQISWFRRWLDQINENHPAIIAITKFEDMASTSQDKIARDILKTLGLKRVHKITTPPQRYDLREIKGRTQLSNTHYERIMDSIPLSLLQKFNWK